MSLREKINKQFNIALKEKNRTLVSTLRLILAAIKEGDIANRSSKNKETIKDPEVVKLLRKMKKQREDSARLYQQGGRQELFDAEVKASTLENKRDKEGLIIDLFRTLEASRRKNNI